MRLESRGALDFVRRDATSAAIHGWVFSFRRGPATAWSCAAGGEDLAIVSSSLGEASPDIAGAFASVPGSDRARFTLRVALPRREKARLFRLTPRFGDDAGSSLFGLPEDAIPWPAKEAVDVIGGDFHQAFEYLGHFVERGGLEPTMDVLDVGCGVGRMAVPLAFYLSPEARYRGFDVAKAGLEWASRVISPRFPNFEFRHVDVRNDAYNPAGKLRSTEFAFPFEDGSFDFVFLTSVFTHLRGDEIRHYLAEIRRVLRSRGRCLATCFRIDDEARSQIAAGRASEPLVHAAGAGLTSDPELPEKAIGFAADVLDAWIRSAGLLVRDRFDGGWCGRREFASYQDILVLEPATSDPRPLRA